MFEDDLGPRSLLHEREVGNRVEARVPAARSPGLDDSLVRHKFNLTPGDVTAEERERATWFGADLCWLVS